MTTMTEQQTERDKMTAHLTRLLERAESTSYEDGALSTESPLSVERSGKFVHVLFSWGGPSTEMLAEFSDEEEAEYWYDGSPVGAWFTYKDWGTREDKYIGPTEAEQILQAITRDPEELSADNES